MNVSARAQWHGAMAQDGCNMALPATIFFVALDVKISKPAFMHKVVIASGYSNLENYAISPMSITSHESSRSG